MSGVSLKPIGKDKIRKLELVLIPVTLMRDYVLEKIKIAEGKLIWLDSLITTVATLARDRAGYTISAIAEELSRTEQTIRNRLVGKSDAGKLVLELYEMSKFSGGKPSIPLIVSTELEHLKHKDKKARD